MKARRLYPFDRHVERKLIFNWWQAIPAKLFGQKYHEYDGIYEIKGYFYKDKLYITKYGKLIGPNT